MKTPSRWRPSKNQSSSSTQDASSSNSSNKKKPTMNPSSSSSNQDASSAPTSNSKKKTTKTKNQSSSSTSNNSKKQQASISSSPSAATTKKQAKRNKQKQLQVSIDDEAKDAFQFLEKEQKEDTEEEKQEKRNKNQEVLIKSIKNTNNNCSLFVCDGSYKEQNGTFASSNADISSDMVNDNMFLKNSPLYNKLSLSSSLKSYRIANASTPVQAERTALVFCLQQILAVVKEASSQYSQATDNATAISCPLEKRNFILATDSLSNLLAIDALNSNYSEIISIIDEILAVQFFGSSDYVVNNLRLVFIYAHCDFAIHELVDKKAGAERKDYESEKVGSSSSSTTTVPAITTPRDIQQQFLKNLASYQTRRDVHLLVQKNVLPVKFKDFSDDELRKCFNPRKIFNSWKTQQAARKYYSFLLNLPAEAGGSCAWGIPAKCHCCKELQSSYPDRHVEKLEKDNKNKKLEQESAEKKNNNNNANEIKLWKKYQKQKNNTSLKHFFSDDCCYNFADFDKLKAAGVENILGLQNNNITNENNNKITSRQILAALAEKYYVEKSTTTTNPSPSLTAYQKKVVADIENLTPQDLYSVEKMYSVRMFFYSLISAKKLNIFIDEEWEKKKLEQQQNSSSTSSASVLTN